MGLIEDYEAYKESGQQKQQYSLEEAYAKHRAELAQGGAIKQGEAPRNPPIGALIGGVGGAVMGMPGGPAGMAAGGVLGAAAGEATQQLAERAMGSPAAPQTTGEAASRMLEESGLQLVGEGIGRLAGKAIAGRQLIQPSTITPEGAKAMRFMNPITGYPGILPAEVTESRPLDILHNIAEHSLIGGGAIQSFKKDREGVFQGISDQMVDALGPRMNADAAGRVARETIQGNLETSRLPAKMIYNNLDSAASSVPVDIKSIKSSTQQMYDIAKQAGGLEDRNMGTTLLEFIHKKPDTVPYSVAKQIRTEVRTLQQTLEKSIEAKGSPAIGKAKTIYGQLTDQIRAGLTKSDPFLSDMWDEANLIEKSSGMQFGNSLIRSMFNKMDDMQRGAPEAMVKEVFKPNSPTTINRVKNAIASENTWNKVLSVQMQDMLRQGVDAEGKLNGRALDEAMFGRNGIGMQGMVAAYGPQRVSQYKEFINALKVAEAKQGEKIGSVAVQLKQPGAVMQLTGAGLALAGVVSDDYSTEGALLGGTIVLGPAIIARAMTNPTTARMILDGFKVPAGTPKGMALAGRIASSAIPRIEPKAAPDTAERRTFNMPTQLMENQL